MGKLLRWLDVKVFVSDRCLPAEGGYGCLVVSELLEYPFCVFAYPWYRGHGRIYAFHRHRRQEGLQGACR